MFAYNYGGIYSPVDGLRLRAGAAQSVRAPTLSNLYSSGSQTFLNGLADPCSANNINNNPNRRANCAAAGVPTTEVVNGVTVPWTNTPASGISGLNGGNPNLREERGRSLTIGFVAQPDMVPGLTFSADWYRVRINNVIQTLGGQTIINQCYDSPSGINNPYCAAVFRNPDGTFRGQSNRIVGGATVSFPTTGQSFTAGPFNFARLETSGIDAEVSYAFTLFEELKVNLTANASYVVNRDQYTDINLPDFRTQLKYELGDPAWAGLVSTDLRWKGVSFNYKVRFIDQMTVGAYDTTHSVQGRPVTNGDSFPIEWYPRMLYHDVRVSYDIDDNYRVYAGVDNVTDRMPPLGLLGEGAGSGIYDSIGRYFYAGAVVKF